MGVSYWESGDRDTAIELTQAGAELMQEAVQTGGMEIVALAVPYGNLAAMHQHMGNGEKAKHFATMMAKVENRMRRRHVVSPHEQSRPVASRRAGSACYRNPARAHAENFVMR